MATADELLAALTNSDEAEKVLVIDNDLRTITIPKSIKALGVESDDEVHRLQFRMPRMCSDVDLSTFNIRINYMNAKQEGDIYVVTDKNILSNSITFSWLVGRNALAYKGNVNFIVCLKESNASGDVLREFNTTVATLPVLEGLEVDPAYLEGELHDVLEQLLSLTVAKVAEVEAAGATQIAKVQQESTKQQDNIVEKGAQVLATIPAEYQTTVKLADEGVRSKADAITRTAEGKRIEVNDASDDNLRGLKLFGKTTQQTYTGKNLLPNTVVTQTVNGVTFTVNEDGSIKANGTATGTIDIYWRNVPISTGKAYVLSGCPTGGSEGSTYMLYAHGFGADIGNGRQFTATADTVDIMLRMISGVTASNLTFYPMIRLASIADSTYEPYTGGIPAPNPDYPQPLVSPGDDGVINTTVCGSNLCNPNNFSAVQYRTVDKDGFINFSNNTEYNNYPTLQITLSKGTYTVGIEIVSLTGDTAVFLGTPAYDYTKKYTASRSVTFTDTNNVSIMIAGKNGATMKVRFTVNVGNTALPYEPYVGSTITTTTPNGLPGIPVTSGGNHVDENGQQWICDEVDFERGVYVQRIGQFTANGTETWTGTYPHVYTDLLDAKRFELDEKPHVWSERFKDVGSYYGHLTNGTASLYNASLTNYPGANWLYVVISDEVNSASKIKEYFAANPTEFIYELATPIEAPLSAADLASFKAAKTAKPYTQIFNDSDVEMEASYNADTEIYIDNKIAERTPRNSYVAPAIVETKSGEVIGVSDSSDDVVHGLKLFGKTKQFTTTGKNLLDTSKLNRSGSIAVDGNTITVTPISTGQAVIPNCTLGEALKASAGDTVTISGKTTGTNRLYIVDTSTSWLWGTSLTLTAAMLASTFYLYGGTTNGTPATITDLQIERGSTATAYEPYTGGMAAPNPDYPQPLESVGESGAINTTVCGGNLYDLSKSWGYGTYQPFLCANGDYYSVAIYPSNGTSQVNVRLVHSDGSGFDYSVIETNENNNQWHSISKKATKDITRICVYNANGVGRTVDKIMVCKGQITTMTDDLYEPYKAQTLTASTPNGLPGIPVTSGGNYTDSDGQQWICDEVDFGRGVYVQRVRKHIFDVRNSYSTQLTNTKHYSGNKDLGTYIGIGGVKGLCSVFGQDKHGWHAADNEHWYADQTVHFYVANENVSEFEAHESVTVLYALATPIETPLTKAELAAYRAAALHTNYPSTTIFNDANAGQEVTYVADTKNWIKNQLAL